MQALANNARRLVEAQGRTGWHFFAGASEPCALVCWSGEMHAWLVGRIDRADLRRVERLAIVALEPGDSDAWHWLDERGLANDGNEWLVDANDLDNLRAACAVRVLWEQPTA